MTLKARTVSMVTAAVVVYGIVGVMPESLVVPGMLPYLGEVRAYVSARASAAGLGESAAYQLVVAVDELVTNAIVHGYQEAGLAGVVRVWVETEDGMVQVVIEDEGAPFDPSRVLPPADLNRPIEQRRSGGLGIYLARQCVDELTHEFVDGRNRNILRVKRVQAKKESGYATRRTGT